MLALFAAGIDDVLTHFPHTPLFIAKIRNILRRHYGLEGASPPNHSSEFLSEFQTGRKHTSIFRFLEDHVVQNNLNKWVRKIHRWLVWPFILILLTALITRGTDFATIIQKIQAPFMLILAFTGAYLWLLPYLSRWQRRKRQEVSATKVR